MSTTTGAKPEQRRGARRQKQPTRQARPPSPLSPISADGGLTEDRRSPTTWQFRGHRIRGELRQALRDLSERGLKRGASWTAELLAGLALGNDVEFSRSITEEGLGNVSAAGMGMGGRGLNAKFAAVATDGAMSKAKARTLSSDQRKEEEDPFPPTASQSMADTDSLLVAKTFFDLGEYSRCAHALSSQDAMPVSHNAKEVFLWGYAKYLAGERRKEEEMAETADPTDSCKVENATIPLLHAELSQAHQLNKLDGFNLYLYGVVLKSMQRLNEARDVLSKAVCEYPLNWSAWLDLAELCPTKQVVDSLTLPQHWVVPLFRAHMYLELQLNSDAAVLYSHLLEIFPTSCYVLAQHAIAEYNQRNFDEAQETFKQVQSIDPFRLHNMDTYSNILYVKESKAELSFLAHSAVRSNKFRPETCCIVGNYYSLKAQHESAVQYFKRALRLNRRYLSAWTLMGHEYVEMKNTPAAIEAYRSAVNINPRDYRAWYGLGQTYEILQMFFYALHYYRKATTLRPYDARMWCALGGCYERLDRVNEAIKCYQRAECHNDREGIAAQQLAKLYADQLHDRAQAAYYYNKHLERRLSERSSSSSAMGQDTIDALKFLASYLRDCGQLVDAERYCLRLMDSNGPEKREAEAMLREIHQLQAAGGTEGAGGVGAGTPARSFGGGIGGVGGGMERRSVATPPDIFAMDADSDF